MQNRAAKLKPAGSSVARGWREIELPLRCHSGYIATLGQRRAVGKSDRPPRDAEGIAGSASDLALSRSLLQCGRKLAVHWVRIRSSCKPGVVALIMKNLALALALCLAVAGGIAAEPGAPAGKVKRAEGSVTIDRAGHVQSLPVGSTVYVGDRIRTGADGSVGITLFDDTLLTAGPRSTLLINDFQFNPVTNEGNLLTTLVKGTLSVVTGLIGKQAPQNVRFRTPTVVLGIRGTEFIVEARGEDE
jgi:hypothetical protein